MIHITIAGRKSPLSQAQMREVIEELRRHRPEIVVETRFMETYGDKDRKTSLRALDKTDFFTREVDELVLRGECRVAVHSAKDLPDPICKGLQIVALTKGVDPSDALVLREGESLKNNGIVATSSERREAAVRQLYRNVRFVDIRGTIAERLEKLSSGEVDGVVIAEAALIRLGLTHLNRVRLPGDTVPFQGQLAVMARDNDTEMQRLFAHIDCRKPEIGVWRDIVTFRPLLRSRQK